MAGSARKKDRRRPRRQQKKRNLQRAQAGSPYRRIGTSGELVAGYINSNWKTNGEASVFILRQVPGGGHAMGAFLVDTWCAGLKDSWGRLDMTFEAISQIEQLPEDDDTDEKEDEEALSNLSRLLSFEQPDVGEQLAAALSQLSRFMRQFDTPEAMFEFIGIDELDEVE